MAQSHNMIHSWAHLEALTKIQLQPKTLVPSHLGPSFFSLPTAFLVGAAFAAHIIAARVARYTHLLSI